MIAEIPPVESMIFGEIVDRWLGDQRKNLEKNGDWLRGMGHEVETILGTGDPREAIMEAIERRLPDIVVVGRRGMGKLDIVGIGNVSSFLTRHSRCPVVVIP